MLKQSKLRVLGWGVSLAIVLLAISWLTLVGLAWASDEQDRDDANQGSDYDFSWLDPDKKIYVLQNRKYTKSRRVQLSILGGVGLSNPYRSVMTVDPRIAYYLNETWGVELFYTFMGNSSNSTIQALGTASPNALPSVREIRSQFGGLLQAAPWYAKINIFNNIVYFDWYFSLGMGQVAVYSDTRTRTSDPSSFQPNNTVGLILGTGHDYHITQNFSLRLDVTDTFYQTYINGLSGDTSLYSNLNIEIGASLRL
jgi:outer membrane beta-barrel protein